MLVKLSFIIPAYNASATIVRCLDSIYALELKETDFEVICIDDCSTDNTISVIEDYAQKHTNITLLCQKENHRQGAARNRGISIAKGKYIVFVDSDDESDKGVLDALCLAEENKLDMVAMHYVNVDENGNVSEKEAITIDGVFSGIDMQVKHPYWCAGPVPYIYKRGFLEHVNYNFKEDVLYEDSDFVTVHLFNATKIMYSPQISYRVYYNASSTTHTRSFKHIADYFLLGTRMLNFYLSLNDTTSKYSLSILEGGSYNIWMSCNRLIKLPSLKDAKRFYNRLDSITDRSKLTNYNEPAYCWTWWTKLCIKHKNIAIFIILIGQLVYKISKFLYSSIKK